MCAHALNNEFSLAGYWPSVGRHEGQRQSSGTTAIGAWRS
ncbi:hypothetical protein A8U91_02879 [Halomonas elongata]|uniref:Uncharacterized protein n=1 Tax=Halomonas elongata TaxID=2746 RepID=A0A1B8NV33_HALEL|nr:hypothetical protein A8U91_02879 [Halomonas elongata]